MPSLHDPKNLTETVELDYFQQPRRFRRVKQVSILLITLASLVFVAATLLPANRPFYQAGPLSAAHTIFQHDCGLCHDSAFQPLGRLVYADASLHSVSDRACRRCHEAAHHQPDQPAHSCANCHQEHRGRPALARVKDGQCTTCHADIKRRKTDSRLENVSDFTTGHPEFALWRRAGSDPGTVQFNHAKHLAVPGQENLRGIDRPLAELKERECGYCHRPDSAGRYVLPIRYNDHCRSCHPLHVGIPGGPGNGVLAGAMRTFAAALVPHPAAGEGPATVRALLRDRFLEFARKNPRVTAAPQPSELPRSLPGGWRGEPATKKQLLWSEQQLQEAERVLFDGADGCRRCHVEQKSPRVNGLPNYARPAIPQRWFTQSKFNHHSHVMLKCVACHDQALTSQQTRDVLMPTIDACRQCHSRPAGARSDCGECHEFHRRRQEPWRGELLIPDLRK